MRTACLVTMASMTPMGAQTHESGMHDALRRHLGDEWRIEERGVAPLRGSGRGRRLPLRLVWAAPYPVAAAIGSLAYGNADLVHRFELRCPPSRRREIVTIHDAAPVRFDDEGSLPRWASESARNAAAIICGSEFAAEEIRQVFGAQRTHVIPSGVDPRWAEAEPFSPTELADAGLREPLVVHAGGASARKNLAALAAAWPAVLVAQPDAFLALSGPPHPRREELFSNMRSVTYVGYRDRTFVTRLIRSAAVVVIPSTYEGFGLPALEAMAAGSAVVAANRSALPEVCGDGALLVQPTAEGIARGIVETLAGGAEVERRREAGRTRARAYTWERAARATAALYEEVVA